MSFNNCMSPTRTSTVVGLSLEAVTPTPQTGLKAAQNASSCKVCNRVFSRNSKHALVKHMRTHTGARPYRCTAKRQEWGHCKKGFATSFGLKRHMKRHSTEPLSYLQCAACPFRATEKHHLVHHIRTHTGEKPFHCPGADCSATFARKSELNRHRRVHTGEKSFACRACSLSFAQKCHLVSHIRTHTGEKPYQCGDCLAAFARRDALMRHFSSCKVPCVVGPA